MRNCTCPVYHVPDARPLFEGECPVHAPFPPLDLHRYLNFGREAAAVVYQETKGKKLPTEIRYRQMVDAAVEQVIDVLRVEGRLDAGA